VAPLRLSLASPDRARMSTIASAAAIHSMRGGTHHSSGQAFASSLSGLGDFTLLQLAEMGEPGTPPHAGASRERLRREIMSIDGIEYADTSARLLEMAKLINPNDPSIEAPFKVAIFASLLSGFASIPLTFHYATAAKFNDLFVTCDPPEVGTTDTMLEVGMWSWAWMEPLTGTMCFVLLCFEFARDQRLAIGGKTAMHALMDHQASKLVKAYPQYDANILTKYGYVLAVRDNEVESIRKEKARLDALRARHS